MAKIDPNTTEDQLYQGGDHRPLLAPHIKGIRTHMIGAGSVKERVEGVILPSYDYDLDTCDEAFPMSVGACWKSSVDSNNPKHFLPNAWAIPLLCYPFMGENNDHFISPMNRKVMMDNEQWSVEDFADAFNDLWTSIKWDKSLTDRDKDYYCRKPDARTDAKIPNRQTRFFSLAEITSRESRERPDVQLIAYTSAAHSYLVDQMRWRTDDDAKPIDPKWPRYMLGDPTRPEAAMVWTVDKIQLDPKDPQATNCLLWTTKREILDSPLHTRVISPETLTKRFLMVDPANWNIPTYQEMVDFMVVNAHEEVTTEMIKAACGHRAEVAERKFRHKSATPRREDDAGDSYNPMDAAMGPVQTDTRSFAPTAAPVPTQPPTPPPADPIDPAATYLAGVPRGKPEQMTLTQLRMTPAGTKVKLDGVWKLVADSGLFPATQGEVVPDDDVVPGDEVVPDDDVVPGDDLPATASGGITPEAKRRMLVPDEAYAALSSARRSELDELSAKLADLQNRDIKDIPADLMDQLMSFLG